MTRGFIQITIKGPKAYSVWVSTDAITVVAPDMSFDSHGAVVETNRSAYAVRESPADILELIRQARA